MSRRQDPGYSVLSLTVPRALKDRLIKYCETQEYNAPYNYVVHKAIAEYLNAHEVVDNSERK